MKRQTFVKVHKVTFGARPDIGRILEIVSSMLEDVFATIENHRVMGFTSNNVLEHFPNAHAISKIDQSFTHFWDVETLELRLRVEVYFIPGQ